MIKVLEILKNFFQEVFKQGLGQSPKVLGLGQSPEVFPYHFYPVAGAAGNRSTANGCTQNLYNVKIDT